ncbi:MAG: CotH kinase family protein [Lachnospiraceae bacterium]|nr:CotH kinase family protein [Lachnospiraceae bacterium]
MKKYLWTALGIVAMLTCIAGCNNSQKTNTLPQDEVTITPTITVAVETAAPTNTPAPTATSTPTPTPTNTPTPTPTNTPTPTPTPVPLEKVIFSEKEFFYQEDISVTLEFDTATEGIIYYTLDGSTPTVESAVYEEPIFMEASEEASPNLYHLRALAAYPDGTLSQVTAHTYFVGTKVAERYSTLIFSITGDPAQLTDAPDGIFYEDNVYNKGRKNERPVYIEVLQPDGSLVFEQAGGIRVYGGKSRGYSIPSMKIYARKEYSPEAGTFPFSLFETPRVDKPDKIVKKYDKLVLRNGGDDMQCAMIRDEFSHMLAAQAGFTDYESVLPALVYMNGEYYGLLWLHESYCDEYFQRKYGESDGEFIICEGSEKTKSISLTDDEIEETAAREYNAMYKKYAYADLTVDETIAELNELLDIENYLKYYAYVLYGGTYDWPNRNYKCYRYYAADGVSYGEGAKDGRWRFLIHDMDSSFGTHTGPANLRYAYNDWADVLNKKHERYSPLFTALMKRKDCRKFFVNYSLELMNTVYAYDNVNTLLVEMDTARYTELHGYYYDYLKSLRKAGDTRIWTNPSYYDHYMEQIRTFTTERPAYAQKYLEEILNME